MEIKTKFNVGDKVWADINGAPSIVTLSSIFIKFYEGDDNVHISYGIKEQIDEQTWRLPEDFFFLSKEKLIEKRNKQMIL